LHYAGPRGPVGQVLTKDDPSAREQRLRPVDLDVTNTRLHFARKIRQENYLSATVRGMWQIARASDRERRGVCALVGILTDSMTLRREHAQLEFLPTCTLAFFRGPANDYFSDIRETLGANLIVELDSVDWALPYPRHVAAFVENFSSAREAQARLAGGV
jgi:hypothetical protein